MCVEKETEEKSPCDGLKLKKCKSTKECAWKNKVCVEKEMEEKSPCDGLKSKQCKSTERVRLEK